MLCRVEMPANEQIFGRFYRYKLLHNIGGSSRLGFFILPLLALFILWFSWSSMGVPTIGIIAVVFVAAYFIFTLYVKPGQIFRKKGGAALNTEITIFTDTGFTRSVRSEEGGFPENSSSQYSALTMAVETNKDFYLFTGPSQAYMVDKAYFTKGTVEDLRATLDAKMGAKFKSKWTKK